MIAHLILVAASGTPRAKPTRAADAWDAKIFARRCQHAGGLAEQAGLRWAIVSTQGILAPGAEVSKHRPGPPPAAEDEGFPAWQQACREGIESIVMRSPELHDVEQLRVDLLVPQSWVDPLTRALPECRFSLTSL